MVETREHNAERFGSSRQHVARKRLVLLLAAVLAFHAACAIALTGCACTAGVAPGGSALNSSALNSSVPGGSTSSSSVPVVGYSGESSSTGSASSSWISSDRASAEHSSSDLASTSLNAQAPSSSTAASDENAQHDGVAPIAPEVSAPAGLLGDQQASSEDGLVVRFLDVGQGDCALVSCAGHHALVDGGPADASQKVYAVLKRLGIEHLDFIVATHADADHVGAISAALNAATCDTCYCSVAESDTRTFESMVRYVGKQNAQLVVPDVPTVVELGDASFSIIGPPEPFPDNDNNGSLVCRVDFGSTSVLFMADAEADAEDALLGSSAQVEADVLKVGHHGSSHSTSDALIRAVSPAYAVVSVGAGNEYGHPAERVLDTLARYGVQVYRTDENGDVIVTSDGSHVDVRPTKEAVLRAGDATESAVESGNEPEESRPETEGQEGLGADGAAAAGVAAAAAGSPQEGDESAEASATVRYIGNSNTNKFHHPTCSSVDDMKESNKVFFYGDRQELIDKGYKPCGRCNP